MVFISLYHRWAIFSIVRFYWICSLHISQPSLSKEIKKLEEELGHQLFIRTNKNMRLNDEGMLLRKRAEDILAMVDKTTEEFNQLDSIIGGEIHIGCAESYLIKYLAQSI